MAMTEIIIAAILRPSDVPMCVHLLVFRPFLSTLKALRRIMKVR
jgi:hypothetical protein